MHPPGGDFDFLVAGFDRCRLVEAFAAELHAGVQLRIDFIVEFENEIAVILFGAEKTVRRIGDSGAHDHAVFDRVLGLAAALYPAVERFAVEERDKAFGRIVNKNCVHAERLICIDLGNATGLVVGH